MRIMLDATSLLLPGGGMKTYMYYWTRFMQRSATQDSIRLFPFFRGIMNLDHESSSVGRRRTTLGTLVVHFSNIKWNPVLEVVG
jgi:hypothetical protein